MKRLTAFYRVALQEMGSRCHTSTIRDCKTVTERIEHEGLSFLTITLPAFARDFEKSLDQRSVDRCLFQGFSWKGSLPQFLGGFLDLVFDRKTGVLLDFPSLAAIQSVRQLTLMYKKIELPCSDERIDSALQAYIQCEQELRFSDLSFAGESQKRFERMGSLLFADLFSKVDLRVFNGEILPKHGPGATAEKLKGNLKYTQREWTSRLETYFPCGEYIFPSWSHFNGSEVQILEPGAERPVRVITVPKTLKTPRIIAIEPTCMQYVQQGILEAIVEEVRADDFALSFICSDSQDPNRHLAMVGSRDGSLATLDLSEASDRVSNQHVLSLTRNHPHLAAGVQACRSRKADVLGKTVRLAKFASMGSALCFPFESMVFLTIIFVGIEQERGHELTKGDIKSYLGRVRVYGDDIIVPVEYVSSVVEALHAYGMKVNSGKSFWTGKFRESCGGDYYDGHDVSVVKVTHRFPSRREHTEEILATVSLRNHLFVRGFYEMVAFLDEILLGVLPVFPIVEPGSPGLGRWSNSPYIVERFHPTLHKPLVRACVTKTRLPKSNLDGYDALTKWFLKRGDIPFDDVNHLLRAGRPLSVDIKTRWVSPLSEAIVI